MLLIGLDAASSLAKFGYAIAQYDSGGVQIVSAGLVQNGKQPDAIDAELLPTLRSSERTLIAIDAPLGWPASLAGELHRHRAGQLVATEKNALFQRETDRLLHKRLGKKPLESKHPVIPGCF